MNERTVFLTALEKTDPAERRTYLDQACAGDPVLRRQVEALLASDEAAGSFLGEPAVEQLAASAGGRTAGAPPAPAGDETQAEAGAGAGGHADLAFLAPPRKAGHLGRLGHYDVLEVIGRGGFGIVLKAFDVKLHRVVAIKVLAPALAGNGLARKRFGREAQAAAAVAHEHVVAIHAVHDEVTPPYFVMQLVAGRSLQDKLDREGPLGLREVLRIGMQTAEGLAAAHRQGLVHRDVKPSNILLENGVERVKLTDFGLARAVDDASLTQSGVVAGTPMYMAPEQARGEQVDHRADLFSLGSVLYAMCTGRPPFRASGSMAVLRRVIEDEPRPVHEVNPDVPVWMEEVIARLHAKRPEDRYQSAAEVAEVLGRHLAELQLQGRTAGDPRPAAPRRRPAPAAAPPARPWLAGLSVGCILLLFVLLLGGLILVGIVAMYFLAAADYGASSVQHPAPPQRPQPARRDPPALAPAEGAGWVRLFNGKDLAGWKTHPDQLGGWSVEGGLLTGRAKDGNTHLFSERGDLGDFHLRVAARINSDGNGGVFFRTPFGLTGGYPAGYEAQILHGPPSPNAALTGSLYKQVHFSNRVVTDDEWFTMEVLARANRVTVKVNGRVTADYFEDPKAPAPARGHLALQAMRPEQTVVQFRKIEVKELRPGE